jgi:hypothetical protein
MATQPRDRWHVGKEIPIALIFALFVQTSGWIWWAATQSAKLDTLTNMMGDFRMSQYTQNDARRDMENMLSRNKEIVRRVEVLEGARNIRQGEPL